jgi:hypothetical protein
MNFGATTKLLEQLDHFYFKLQCHYDEKEQTIKKDMQTTSKWQESTKENPKTVNYANAVAIILGQEFEENKYLVGIDIDDKKDGIIKDVERKNGIKYFDDFCKQNKYDPYGTLTEKTRSGGSHFYYYVDEDTLLKLGKNKTDIYYGVNTSTSIDFKTTDGFFICSPSKLKYQDTEQKYEWLSKTIDISEIQKLPNFLFKFVSEDAKFRNEKKVVKQIVSPHVNTKAISDVKPDVKPNAIPGEVQENLLESFKNVFILKMNLLLMKKETKELALKWLIKRNINVNYVSVSIRITRIDRLLLMIIQVINLFVETILYIFM